MRNDHTTCYRALTARDRRFGGTLERRAAELGLRSLKAVGESSIRKLDAMAESWRPWRSYAAIHIWKSGATT